MAIPKMHPADAEVGGRIGVGLVICDWPNANH